MSSGGLGECGGTHLLHESGNIETARVKEVVVEQVGDSGTLTRIAVETLLDGVDKGRVGTCWVRNGMTGVADGIDLLHKLK